MTTKTNLFVLGGLLAALCSGLSQPIIVLQPQSQFVVVGASLSLSVSAIGFEPLRYQWRRNEAPLTGQTIDTLVLTNVQSIHSGRYSVVVTDDDSQSTTSETARLTVHSTFTRVTTGRIATDAEHSFGCSWGDYDDDGFLELIVGNGVGEPNALYHNDGNGTFTRATTGEVGTLTGDADGVVWGDYDNDGDLDLFVANWRLPSFLFRNDGGNFTRVIEGDIGSNVADSLGAAWGDYDNDGFLDLVVANSTGQSEFLYRNNGNGTFSQFRDGPVATSGTTSESPLWSDYDNDGHLDLFVSPDGFVPDARSLFFRNEGNGEFASVTPPMTEPGEGGTDWGDFDNDGDLDLIGSRVAGSYASIVIYRNDGGGMLTPVTLETFEKSQFWPRMSIWGDYDNDGWLDFFCSTFGGRTALQKDLLFRNNGDGSFTRITEGEIVNTLSRGSFGAAWCDYDNDGFLDLFAANGGIAGADVNFLFHNDGNNNRWLHVNCVGLAANRSSIGARVRVQVSIDGVQRTLLREVTSGSGNGGSALRVHFGLGDATNVDLVRVEWPSGTGKEWRNVAVNQILTLEEPPMLIAAGINTSGEFQMIFKGGREQLYAIEYYSTNIGHWTLLTVPRMTNVVTTITDPTSSAAGHRFYRARRFEIKEGI